MKHILVPTDFSTNSANAFRYAAALSRETNYPISLLHLYHPTPNPMQPTMIIPMDELTKNRQEAMDQFYNTVLTPEDKKGVSITPQIDLGLAGDRLVELSDKAEVIVMSTSGESDLVDRVLGSVSSHVALKASCPVWLIPPACRFRSINNILYASNHESADQETVQEAIDLAEEFGATIHFVHVDKEIQPGDFEKESNLLKEIIKTDAPDLDFHAKIVEADTVWEGLHEYADSTSCDVIVMTTKHRNFFENLFHKSTTKMMVQKDKDIALLVLHKS